ncbi:GntR family transcriptional regulator [Streptomyces polyrhachis]|uniref:GntR family transcriptional regulator n=1 Tax=Streptomyces polyrhachis TaxID=1282885 RepID=A0ABW2GC90_9ACTN
MNTDRTPSAGHGASARQSGPRLPAQRTAAPRLDRTSVRAQTLEVLRAALADGRLRVGHVYSAPALAAPLGVSATPVREAMQILAAEGAVQVLPNRGFRIAVPPVPADVAAVRALLVLPAVLAAEPDPPALRPCAAAPGREADRAFHAALLAPAANPELSRVAAELYERSGRPPAAPADRLALVDALSDGDRKLADRLLRGLLGA